jgi:uncharacterized alkaline shock family protein YloU
MVTKKTKKTVAPTVEKAEPKKSLKEISERTDLGEIKIHENVIGDVVKEALVSMKDAVELEGSSLIDSIAGLVGSRSKGAIGIDMQEDAVNIAVKVNIVYGENVPSVSARVQNTVKNEVKKMTGLDVGKVDVFVQKLVRPDIDEEEMDEDID